MISSLKNKHDVCDFISEYMVGYKFTGQPQRFLPASALSTITDKKVIRQVIAQDKKNILNNQEQEQLVDRIYKDGRKLFATCVDCHKSTKYVKVMLENGLTDARLPLGVKDFDSLSQKRGFVNSFMDAQKRFNTIFFREGRFEELIDDLWDRFSIPIHFEEIEANFKGKGAFGAVYKVKIHPDQRSFPCETNNDDLFAMKITQHKGRDETDHRENREQNYHRDMEGQNHPHLVKCLTSFTLGPKYYMVYELANCNLESFILDNSCPTRISALTASWITQQLAGLAGAVRVVHNPKVSLTSSSGSTLNVPSIKLERTGYIHDIKPENILVFKNREGAYFLRLADFSCARVAEYINTISGKRVSWMTDSKSGTPIYRAPEASLEKKTSRPYDMWSLGCVYLEILVWYIDGYQALESFRDSREGPVHPHGLIDEGFYYETESGGIQLRKPVVDMIEHLSRRCEGGLKDIVDTIPSLLKIKPTERLNASQLVEKLKHLVTGTSNSTSTGTSNSTSTGTSNSTSTGTDTSTGTSTSTDTILAARPIHTTSLPAPTSTVSNLPSHDSNTDSDFSDILKITPPSDS